MEIVAEVFNEVQDSSSISSKLVYTLLEQYEVNRSVFIKAMEQCYLKIVKSMLRAPRKLIEKYEKLTEKLFEIAYRLYASKGEDDDSSEVKHLNGKQQLKKNGCLKKEDIHHLFQHFLAFFSGALDSSQIQIRVFAARIIFQLLKILPTQTLIAIIEAKVAKALIAGTLSLMKEKRGNLKLIGIKITSFLQKLMDRNDVTNIYEAQILRSEMLRSMCMDDKDQIRKLALINLEMSEHSFPHLIKRIRDKNPEIRATVFKKLIKEQVPLVNLSLSDIYKLIYDGLGSRESHVRDACIRYLSLNYSLFKEEAEKMDIERETTIPALKCNGIDERVKEIRLKIMNFLKTFEMEKSLYYPELYETLEQLVRELVKSIIGDSEGLSLYLHDCFVNHLSLKKKKKHTIISLEPEEIMLLRIVSQMTQSPEEKVFLSTEVVTVIEDTFPSGLEISSVITYFATTQPNLFSLYQTLLTAEMLLNCDESGKNKLEETLKHLVVTMSNANLITTIPSDASEEYNDVFYQLDPDIVKNNIFAQTYFQSPIVTCSYELLPLIVRILKKVVRDGRGVNVQLIQLISEVHEPLAKDSDNDSHFDLPSELERIQKSLSEEKAKVQTLDKELSSIRQNKSKQREMYDLELEKEERSANVRIWQEKEETTMIKIFDISMRQLILVQALLTSTKLDPKDQAIVNLLQQIIMPGLNSNDDNLVAHSLKALALYVLIDRNYCNDFFSVFSDLLLKNYNCASCTPQEIISLRSIVDFILLYDLSKKTNDDQDDIDIPFTQELILQYAFQADTLLRTISIEGLSKLLFNAKLQDPHSMVCLLMVIWFDTKICQKEGFKAVQILSTLFKTFTATSLTNLQVFERALELFSQLIVTLDKKGLVFNEDYVIFDHLNENFTSKALRVGINLMSYEYHKSTDALSSEQQTEFGPQEKFFIFLAYKCSKERRFQCLFEKVTPFFDFSSRSSINELQVILKFLNDATENCTTSKALQAAQKMLQDKIRVQDQKSKNIEEDLPADAAAADYSLADSTLFKLTARQVAICQKLVDQIENNLVEMDVILKNLQDSKIIVLDTVEQRERRNKQLKDDEEFDEEQAAGLDGEENLGDDQEEEEITTRKERPRKTNRKKVMQEQEEEDDAAPAVAAAVIAGKKKGGKKAEIVATRGKKRKNIQEEEDDHEQEPIEDEVEEVEEINNKRAVTQRRGKVQPLRRGGAKNNVVEINIEEQTTESDQEEEDEEEEEEEEEEKVTKGRVQSAGRGQQQRGKANVLAVAGRRGVKQSQEEVDDDIEEEEDEEEVVNRRQSSRGLNRRLTAKHEDDVEEVVDRQRNRPSGRKVEAPAKITAKSAAVEKKSTRGGRNNTIEEEEQDHVAEEESQGEEQQLKRRSGRPRSAKSAGRGAGGSQKEEEEDIEEEEEVKSSQRLSRGQQAQAKQQQQAAPARRTSKRN